MLDMEKLMIELNNLYHYVQGAHSTCDHDNASATFHQVSHKLLTIITEIEKCQSTTKN